jgi:hypothetical protein
MNLTDYPTPRSEFGWKRYIETGNEEELLIVSEQFEREAAAWKAVAEMLYEASRQAVFTFEHEEADMNEADEAFDALKSQLEKP